MGELIIIFLLSLVFEVVYTYWSLSVARGDVGKAAVANFLIPFISLLPMAYVIDGLSWQDRLVRCIPVGFAYAIGTAMVILYSRREPCKDNPLSKNISA